MFTYNFMIYITYWCKCSLISTNLALIVILPKIPVVKPTLILVYIYIGYTYGFASFSFQYLSPYLNKASVGQYILQFLPILAMFSLFLYCITSSVFVPMIFPISLNLIYILNAEAVLFPKLFVNIYF